jgi:hypothetical protein
MFSTSIARRIERGLVALTFVVAMVSLTSPGTAYAKHGNGAAIALGILGGALAGAAIASSTAPGYYAAPPRLLSLWAAGLLRRAGAGLFLRPGRRVLCSSAVLWTAILLRRILKGAPSEPGAFSSRRSP